MNNSSKKVFQEDSYLKTLEADVVSCNKSDEYYEVILDQTIFYPHMSGGQPKDEGTINGLKVFDVIEDGELIIHRLKEPIKGRVLLEIDFSRRFDHMQQHTGQHILSYAFSKLFDGNTVGFHLSQEYATIDLDIALNPQMIEAAEALSNRIIYENKRVRPETYSYKEALNLNLRKIPPVLDYLRIINIEGYEYNACGGTHVKNTGEVGIVKIVKTENYKGGTRLEFLCGQRALRDYRIKNSMVFDLAAKLTCSPHDLEGNLDKNLKENKKLKKDISELNNLINEFKAKELRGGAIRKDKVNYIFNKSDDDVKDLRYICSNITGDDDNLVVLVSERENKCNFILGQSKNLSFDLKTIFEVCRPLIEGKGGGSNNLMQATGSVLKGQECLDLARQMLGVSL